MDLLNESYKYQFVSNDKLKIARIELPNVAGRAEGTEYEARVWHGPLTMMVSRRLVHSRKTM
jgi:hypothetical protein